MLHLLQPNTPKGTRLFVEVVIASIFLHCIFFIALFIVKSGIADSYAVTLHATQVDPIGFAVMVERAQEKPARGASNASVPHAVVPTKTVIPKKVAPPKKAVPQKTPPKPNPASSKPVQKKASEAPKQQPLISQKEQDARDLQVLLQEEMQEHWHPPVGLSKDLVCEMVVCVDAHGNVSHFDFVTTSGVLVYDVHAQSTLMAMEYPKQAWGKQLTITFKQT